MDKATYYEILDDLEGIRSQLICRNPRNPGLHKISSDLIGIMERIIQYRDVLLGVEKVES